MEPKALMGSVGVKKEKLLVGATNRVNFYFLPYIFFLPIFIFFFFRIKERAWPVLPLP
jgi:hypothetical protein